MLKHGQLYDLDLDLKVILSSGLVGNKIMDQYLTSTQVSSK